MYSNNSPQKANTSLKDQAIAAALKGLYATPMSPDKLATDKFWSLNLNDVSPEYLFSSLSDYSASELLNQHMARMGGKMDTSPYNKQILVIYAMMREDLITVCSKTGETTSRFFTLNKDILMMLNPAECTANILNSIVEERTTISPNSIHCIEVIPRCNGSYVSFEFYEAHYILDSDNDFVTFASVGKLHTDNLVRSLSSRVYELRYYKAESNNCTKTIKIVTTLSESILLHSTTKEIFDKMMNSVFGRSFLTLSLPSLEDKENEHGVMHSVFLPHILSMTPLNDYIPQNMFKPFK